MEDRKRVVFYIDDKHQNNMYVSFGVLDYQSDMSGTYYISKLKAIETRLVNGIPFDDFKSEIEFHKLPKGWTYNTPLWEITEDTKKKNEIITLCRNRDFKNINDLQWMYDNGFLVEREDVEPIIDAEYDHGTYRVVKRYPHWTQAYGEHNNVQVSHIFTDFFEAQKYIDNIRENRNKRSVLFGWISRYEDIDEFLLDRYEKDYGGINLDKIKSKILELPRLYDIIFRYYKGKILYQYRSQNNNEWFEITV